MMKKGLLTVLMCAFSAIILAQAFGEIRGKVFDDQGRPLPGVAVQVFMGDQSKGTYTDNEGKFKVKPLIAGTYKLTFNMMTFSDKTLMNVQVLPDRITFIDDVSLQEATTEIGPADIVWLETPLINIDNPGMESITAKVFEHQPAVKNINSYISYSVAGVTTNAEGTELYFRGSRAGTVLYFVDGVKIIGSAPQIPQSGIGSINVYTGGVPAKYGDVTGGVIVIETKNYFDIYNKKKYAH